MFLDNPALPHRNSVQTFSQYASRVPRTGVPWIDKRIHLDQLESDNVGLAAQEVDLLVRNALETLGQFGWQVDRLEVLVVRGDGGDWVTPNWSDASRKMTLDVRAALGGIEVVRVANSGS